MTNEHVVEDDAAVQIYPASGSGPHTGEVIGTDELRDLAVVRICCNSGFRALALADQSEMRQGAEVVAFGYPYRARVLSGLSVSEGIISSVEFNSSRDSYLVQTDAAINPGNSGGPLVNKIGKVVGTVASKVEHTPGGRPIDNIGFAVAAITMRARLSALEAGAGRVPTPTPTITPTPTPIPPPAIPPTPVPDNWDLVLVAVGDTNQRVLDAGKRRAIAYSLGLQDNQVPDVETGFKLIDGRNTGRAEVIADSSGIYTVNFAEIPGSFNGFKPPGSVRRFLVFGRLCQSGGNCDNEHFQELKNYISIDENASVGSFDVSPQIMVTASVPEGYALRIEMMAYYTSSSRSPAETTPTPTPTPTSGSTSQLPAQLAAVIFDGRVTVAGSTSKLEDLTLYAKVGDWISDSVTLGDGTSDLNGFENLTASPPSELLGQEVKFLLGGTVESTTTDYYAIIAPDGSILINEPIGLPIFRTVRLDFPRLP